MPFLLQMENLSCGFIVALDFSRLTAAAFRVQMIRGLISYTGVMTRSVMDCKTTALEASDVLATEMFRPLV
jgi:hypothetical protein